MIIPVGRNQRQLTFSAGMGEPLMAQDNPKEQTGLWEERKITGKVRRKEWRERNARYKEFLIPLGTYIHA